MDKIKQQVLGTFEVLMPLMSEQEVERLLAFGQGLTFKVSQEKGRSGRPLLPGQGEARPSA